MSTKIYEAYRTKRKTDNLFKLIRAIRTSAAWAVLDRLEEIMLELTTTVNLDSPKVLEQRESVKEEYKTDIFLKSWCAAELMDKEYRKQANETSRNLFDYDVSATFHELYGRYYIIPYSDMKMRGIFDFLKNMKGLEDYSYWDNVDKPDEITEKDWRNRESDWDKIHEAGWQNHFTLNILNKNTWFYFSPVISLNSDGTLMKDRMAKILGVGKRP